MKPLKERTVREEMEIPVPIPTADGCGTAETITVRVMVMRDPETNDFFLDDEALEAIDRAKSRHLGLLSPEDIRGLRAQFHLTQGEMSRLLKIGEKTYTRWESGRSRPSQAMNLLLLALRDGVISTGWLQTVLKKQFAWSPQPVSVIWTGFGDHGKQGMGVSPPCSATYSFLPHFMHCQSSVEVCTPSTKSMFVYEEFSATA